MIKERSGVILLLMGKKTKSRRGTPREKTAPSPEEFSPAWEDLEEQYQRMGHDWGKLARLLRDQ
ncbi:MAG: hypothetical protein HY400_00345 [Elusimicrobia bacterium]|nr:hypothetical protein [Elusimicrobiota bacterium]